MNDYLQNKPRLEKEKSVSIFLQHWFEQYAIKCWQNSGENSFHIKGNLKKPDMLIYSNKLQQYIIIEIKTGKISRELHNASKILDYWMNYTTNETEYYIDTNKISISSFVIATLYSPFGKLLQEDTECIKLEKKFFYDYALEPLYEFRRSRDFLRQLWANWRRIRKKEEAPGVGVILSNNLNQLEYAEVIDSPLLFDMHRETNTKGNRQWLVRQQVL